VLRAAQRTTVAATPFIIPRTACRVTAMTKHTACLASRRCRSCTPNHAPSLTHHGFGLQLEALGKRSWRQAQRGRGDARHHCVRERTVPWLLRINTLQPVLVRVELLVLLLVGLGLGSTAPQPFGALSLRAGDAHRRPHMICE
jgi:hypothetical protein